MGKYKCSNCDDTGFVFTKGHRLPWTTCSNMKCPLFTYKFVVEQYDMTNKVHPVDNMKTVDNVLEFLNRYVNVVTATIQGLFSRKDIVYHGLRVQI